jgi:hypothetical protein
VSEAEWLVVGTNNVFFPPFSVRLKFRPKKKEALCFFCYYLFRTCIPP